MFCEKCGSSIDEDSVFCQKCGVETGKRQSSSQQVNQQGYDRTPNQLIQQLSSKVHTLGVMWMIIGCLQLLLGGAVLLFLDYTYWFVPLVGILNIIGRKIRNNVAGF